MLKRIARIASGLLLLGGNLLDEYASAPAIPPAPPTDDEEDDPFSVDAIASELLTQEARAMVAEPRRRPTLVPPAPEPLVGSLEWRARQESR